MALQGTMMVWCQQCGAYFTSDEEHVCPRCHCVAREMRCTRCGHTWTLSGRRLPKCCPSKRCKSPYWNRARMMQRKRKGDEDGL